MPNNRIGSAQIPSNRPTDAAQFMPFAALTGFETEVRNQERRREIRRSVGEERAAHISRMFCRLSKGDRIRLEYYNRDHYAEVYASIRQIDATFHVLELIDICEDSYFAEPLESFKPTSLRVPFEDIWDIDWA